jgi:hypothetical protein
MLKNKYSTNVPAFYLLSDAVRDDYVNPATHPTVVPAAASNLTMTHIMLQKYIALYAWGVQVTWADMRRFHYNNDFYGGYQVYAGFTPPSGTSLHSTNLGKLVYRCRPRYNSEYLYNIPSLTLIGAYPPGNDYHTKECWFSKP